MRICNEDEVLNPKTNRCVKRTGKIGREILSPQKYKSKCKDDQVLNPKTKRCVKKIGKIGRDLTKHKPSPLRKDDDKSKNKCKAGEILNPKTNRCVKKDGKIGRQIMDGERKHKSPVHIEQKHKDFTIDSNIKADLETYIVHKDIKVIVHEKDRQKEVALKNVLNYIHTNIDALSRHKHQPQTDKVCVLFYEFVNLYNVVKTLVDKSVDICINVLQLDELFDEFDAFDISYFMKTSKRSNEMIFNVEGNYNITDTSYDMNFDTDLVLQRKEDSTFVIPKLVLDAIKHDNVMKTLFSITFYNNFRDMRIFIPDEFDEKPRFIGVVKEANKELQNISARIKTFKW